MTPEQRPPVLAGGRHPLSDRACLRCGYGIAAGRAPDRCPMCGGGVWRPLELDRLRLERRRS